jgi:hypothetical protein
MVGGAASLGFPGIDDRNVKSIEVFGVAGRDRGPSSLGDACDQRVAEVGGSAGALPLCGQTGRGSRGDRIKVQDPVGEVFFDNLREGALESETPLRLRKQGKAESRLEPRDGRYPDGVGGLTVQPGNYGGVRVGPHERG